MSSKKSLAGNRSTVAHPVVCCWAGWFCRHQRCRLTPALCLSPQSILWSPYKALWTRYQTIPVIKFSSHCISFPRLSLSQHCSISECYPALSSSSTVAIELRSTSHGSSLTACGFDWCWASRFSAHTIVLLMQNDCSLLHIAFVCCPVLFRKRDWKLWHIESSAWMFLVSIQILHWNILLVKVEKLSENHTFSKGVIKISATLPTQHSSNSFIVANGQDTQGSLHHTQTAK
jgi:hypothetical protein